MPLKPLTGVPCHAVLGQTEFPYPKALVLSSAINFDYMGAILHIHHAKQFVTGWSCLMLTISAYANGKHHMRKGKRM